MTNRSNVKRRKLNRRVPTLILKFKRKRLLWSPKADSCLPFPSSKYYDPTFFTRRNRAKTNIAKEIFEALLRVKSLKDIYFEGFSNKYHTLFILLVVEVFLKSPSGWLLVTIVVLDIIPWNYVLHYFLVRTTAGDITQHNETQKLNQNQ